MYKHYAEIPHITTGVENIDNLQSQYTTNGIFRKQTSVQESWMQTMVNQEATRNMTSVQEEVNMTGNTNEYTTPNMYTKRNEYTTPTMYMYTTANMETGYEMAYDKYRIAFCEPYSLTTPGMG